jgi:hypothetical protein
MKYLLLILLLVGCGRNTPYKLSCAEGSIAVQIVKERQSDKTIQATIGGQNLWLEPQVKPRAFDEDFCFDGALLSDPLVE